MNPIGLHALGGQRRLAGTIPINRIQVLLDEGPVDALRQLRQRMVGSTIRSRRGPSRCASPRLPRLPGRMGRILPGPCRPQPIMAGRGGQICRKTAGQRQVSGKHADLPRPRSRCLPRVSGFFTGDYLGSQPPSLPRFGTRSNSTSPSRTWGRQAGRIASFIRFTNGKRSAGLPPPRRHGATMSCRRSS
jgi:hypothetical protein